MSDLRVALFFFEMREELKLWLNPLPPAGAVHPVPGKGA